MRPNPFQQFVACILLISLILQSCSNAINPPIAKQQVNGEQVAIKQLADKKLTSKDGHEITFYDQESQLQAEIEEKIGSFSRTHIQPVYLERGIDLDKEEKVQVILPQ